MQLPAIARRLERDRHLGPFLEWSRAAELDAVFVDDNGIGRQFQFCLPSLNRYGLFKRTSDESFCAHRTISTLTRCHAPSNDLGQILLTIFSRRRMTFFTNVFRDF